MKAGIVIETSSKTGQNVGKYIASESIRFFPLLFRERKDNRKYVCSPRLVSIDGELLIRATGLPSSFCVVDCVGDQISFSVNKEYEMTKLC